MAYSQLSVFDEAEKFSDENLLSSFDIIIENGELASAALYSLIETAKANGLIVEKYLVYIMDKVANRDPLSEKENLLEHMPWSEVLPAHLKNTKR